MSVFFTQLVTEYVENNDNVEGRGILREYFGSVPMSCLVLFQTMTGGIDWADVAKPLTIYISPFLAVVFSFYMAFVLFAMLNVITGVFVESALESDAEEKDATMVSRLLEFLSGCPSAADGALSWDEFSARLSDPAMICYFQSVDLDPAEAASLFKLCDSDQNGTVDPEEFVMGCLRLRGHAKAIDLATLMYENRKWFRMVDQKLRKLTKETHANHRQGSRPRHSPWGSESAKIHGQPPAGQDSARPAAAEATTAPDGGDVHQPNQPVVCPQSLPGSVA